jgi:hypothetical protein
MAKSVIPSPLERRHVLEGRLDPTRAARIAEAYLAENRSVEAIAFLALAGAEDRLDSLRAEAVSQGDAFLLREVARAQGRAIAGDEWAGLAAAATAAGKELYAEQARRQTDRRVDGSAGG